MSLSQRAVEAALNASGHSTTEYNSLWMERALTAALAWMGCAWLPAKQPTK